jgi:hypothetical protein
MIYLAANPLRENYIADDSVWSLTDHEASAKFPIEEPGMLLYYSWRLVEAEIELTWIA